MICGNRRPEGEFSGEDANTEMRIVFDDYRQVEVGEPKGCWTGSTHLTIRREPDEDPDET